MRAIVVGLASLSLVAAARASSTLDVITLARPPFPPPVSSVGPSDRHFVLVSSRYRSPTVPTPVRPPPPSWAPQHFRGQELLFAIRQTRPSTVFFVYGSGGAGRYLIGADARTHELRYAFDFVKYLTPPGGGEVEEVAWAREIDGILYVEHRHLTYASATNSRNGYISAIDLGTRKLRWRSAALVANASTFVLDGGYIVSGYGFTAEPDFLYLLDRRTGGVLDRLALPTGPEIVRKRGNKLHVRTYDHVVVAQTIGP
jgi:hypothetical protein